PNTKSHLVCFYGNDCEMCEYMYKEIKKLEKRTGVKIRRFETWSKPENEKLRQICDSKAGCGGVPFFYNKKTRRWICGATTSENLKAWAEGKACAPFLAPPAKFKSAEGAKTQGIIGNLRERGREAMEEKRE
ncbi:hypothetical protein T492DRAFT_558701, partial [Pavlovales sp. CCMP2436]